MPANDSVRGRTRNCSSRTAETLFANERSPATRATRLPPIRDPLPKPHNVRKGATAPAGVAESLHLHRKHGSKRRGCQGMETEVADFDGTRVIGVPSSSFSVAFRIELHFGRIDHVQP